MKYLILMGFLALIARQASAQTDTIPRAESRLFKANVIMPGLSYELALGSSTTFIINPYMVPGYTSQEGLSVTPIIRADFRKYYNFLRRYFQGQTNRRKRC